MAAFVPTGADANTLTGVFQDFSPRSCSEVMPRQRGERRGVQIVAFRCPTFRGYTVHFFHHQAGNAVRFDAPGRPAEAPQLNTRFGYGDRIEWRGAGAGADFEPQAAIMRSRQARDGQLSVPVYEVLKVESGTVCLAAIVEAPASPEGLARARTVADEVAKTFKCGSSEPQLSGFD